MACRLSCIGTKVGGIPDFVTDGENGILIAPGDKEALIDAIWRLYSEEKVAREIGKRARETVQQDFSIQAVTEAHIETFEDVSGMP
jgi:glycosyltransferase involved in cell wall biosynthesis